MKKNKALKWILVALAALAAAGVLAIATLAAVGLLGMDWLPGKKQDQKLYWNVEKVTYSTGELPRTMRDGQYVVRFAVDGEQVDLPVADLQTVNFIDTLEVMGLVFDDNGVVTGVRRVEEFAGKIVAEDYYVESVTEDALVCNSLGTLRGNRLTLKLTPETKVYGVEKAGSLLCGLPGTVQVGGRILAVCNDRGETTHVYAEAPFVAGDVYWNVSRKYDSNTKMTTRPLDAAARYEYQFAVNGELVTLFTKDQKVANAIDAIAAKCMGLTFDDEGYITGVVSTKNTTGNSSFGSWAYVMQMDDRILSVTKFASDGTGTKSRGELAADCKIFDCSGTGEYVGVPAELKQYDQIHGLKNPAGEICVVFIVNRMYDTDIYWNVSRQWNSAAKATKRVPDANGYYHIKLACNGEQVTLRTQDKDIVNAIDSTAVKCFGLEVEADVITAFRDAKRVWGGQQFCSWDIVTSVKDGKVVAKEADTKKAPQTYTGTMAEDCKVYNVTANASFVGEKTTLQVGDKIHALKDLNGKITHIFVVDRPVYATIYWNVDRQWSSEKNQTKRTPNEQGYYEIVLAVNGEQKTFKTKSKSIIDSIDSTAVRCFGLYVSGDVITKYFKTSAVVGGDQFCSWDIVTAIDGNKVSAKEQDASKGDVTYTAYMNKSTKVYDVTGNGEFIGEATTLEVGDKIHALRYDGGAITYIYVVDRVEKVVEKTAHCDHCDQEVTWYSWNGEDAFEDGKHYYLRRDITISDTAYIGAADATDMDVVLDLCGKNITASVRAFRIYGNFWLYDSADTGTIYGNATGQATGFYVYDGAVFNMYGGTFVGGEKANTQCGIGAVGLNDGVGSVFNMYGGKLINGNTKKDGGNLTLYKQATFCMYGGEISGGKTAGKGGNLLINSAATFHMYGGAILGGQAEGAGDCVYAEGAVKLEGKDKILVDGLLLKNPLNIVGTLAEDSQVGIALISGSGVFSGETVEQNKDFFDGDGAAIIYRDGKLELLEKADKSGYCEACQTTVDWYIWDGAEAMTSGCHYYLDAQVEISATAYIGSETDTATKVCLDLCGQNIVAKVRAFRIYGTLNLMDSAQTDGTIYGNASGQATGFYVYDAGTFNMYGGTFMGRSSANSQCGIGALGLKSGSKAVFNMYGGKLVNGNTKKDGGNLTLYHSSTFNMYGGEISGGKTLTDGGSIQATKNSVIHLYGGTIGMGEASGTGNCINALGKIVVHGQDKITVAQIRLGAGVTLQIDGELAKDSQIGIVLDGTTGVFTGDTVEANRGFFKPEEGREVIFADGKLKIQ